MNLKRKLNFVKYPILPENLHISQMACDVENINKTLHIAHSKNQLSSPCITHYMILIKPLTLCTW